MDAFDNFTMPRERLESALSHPAIISWLGGQTMKNAPKYYKSLHKTEMVADLVPTFDLAAYLESVSDRAKIQMLYLAL